MLTRHEYQIAFLEERLPDFDQTKANQETDDKVEQHGAYTGTRQPHPSLARIHVR